MNWNIKKQIYRIVSSLLVVSILGTSDSFAAFGSMSTYAAEYTEEQETTENVENEETDTSEENIPLDTVLEEGNSNDKADVPEETVEETDSQGGEEGFSEEEFFEGELSEEEIKNFGAAMSAFSLDPGDEDTTLYINGEPFGANESIAYGDMVKLSLSAEGDNTDYYYLPTTSNIDGTWLDFENNTYCKTLEPGEDRSYYIGFFSDNGEEDFSGKYILKVNKAIIGSVTNIGWGNTGEINLSWSAPASTTTGGVISAEATTKYIINIYKNGKEESNIVKTVETSSNQYDIDEIVKKDNGYGIYYFSITPVSADRNRYEEKGIETFSEKYVYQDETKPVIKSYTYDSDTNKLYASVVDNETCITEYAFSTAEHMADIEWIPVDTNKAGESIDLEYEIKEGGKYYLYVVDDANSTVSEKDDNIAKSESPIVVTKLVYNNTYSMGVKQDPVTRYFYGDEGIAIPTPVRIGFTFTGWRIGAEDSTEVISDYLTDGKLTKDSKYFAKTVNLFATWTNKSVSVSVYSDDELTKVYDNADITLAAMIAADNLEKEDNVSVVYQWYKDGVAIEGTNSATYKVRNVDDSGKYSVKVSMTVAGEIDEYKAESENVNVEITRANLEISASEIEIEYGQEIPDAFSKSDFEYVGLYDGDDSLSIGNVISVTKNDINAYEKGASVGTYYVLPVGFSSGNYTITCNITRSLKVVPKDAVAEGSGVDITLDEKAIYFEDADKQPKITIIDTAFDPAEELTSEDYSVEYSDNGAATDKAKAVITFKGNYKGTVTKYYTVNKNDYTASVTITGWKYGDFADEVNTPVVRSTSSDRVVIPADKIRYFFREKNGDTYTEWHENSIENAKLFDAGEYQLYVQIDALDNYNPVSTIDNPTDFIVSKRVIILKSDTKEWEYTGTTYSAPEVSILENAIINGENITADGFALGDSFMKTTAEETIINVGEKKNAITYTFAGNTKEKNYDIKTIEGTLSVTKAELIPPSVVNWSRAYYANASWISVTRPELVVEYEVELYSVRAGVETKIATVEAKTNSYNFLQTIRDDANANGLAEYYFRVKSIPEGGKNKDNYKTTDFSDKSAALYTAKVNVVKGDEGVDTVSIGGQDSIIMVGGQGLNIEATYKQGYAPAKVVWVSGSVQDTDNNWISITENAKASTYAHFKYYASANCEYTITAFSIDQAPAAAWSFESDYVGRYSKDNSDMTKLRIDYVLKDSLELESYGVFRFEGDEKTAMEAVEGQSTSEGQFELNKWTKVGTTTKDEDQNETFASSVWINEPGAYYVAARDNKGQVAWAGPINVYKIEFSAGEGTGSIDSILKVENYDVKKLPGAEEKIVKAGYSFTEWEDAEHKKRYVNEGVFSDNRDATLVAKFSKELYKYTVKYYEMDVDGKYSDTPTSSAEYKALINSVISSTDDGIQKETAGFTFDAEKSDESVKITDNNQVLKIYYSRNKYKITYKYTDVDDTEKEFLVNGEPFTEEYYWGKTLADLEDDKFPVKAGYDFVGWTYAGSGVRPESMPVTDITASGYFKPKQSVYYVHYLLQGFDEGNDSQNYSEKLNLREERNDEHDKDLTFTISMSDSNEFAKRIEGFTIDKIGYALGNDTPVYADADTTITASVNNTDTLHVYYYYTRNTYKISLNMWKGGREETSNLIYDAFWNYKFGEELSGVSEKIEEYYEKKDSELTNDVTVNINVENPELDGYSLAEYSDWSTGSRPHTMPAGDVTLSRDYIRNSDKEYLVNVFFENENEEYEKITTLNFYAPLGTNVAYKDGEPGDDTYNVYSAQVATTVQRFEFFDFHDYSVTKDWDETTVLSNGNPAPTPVKSGKVTDGVSENELEFNLYFDRKEFAVNVYYFYNISSKDMKKEYAFKTERYTGVWGKNATQIDENDGSISGFNPMLYFDEDCGNGNSYRENKCVISYNSYYRYDGSPHWPHKQFETVASLTDGSFARTEGQYVKYGQHDVDVYVYYTPVDSTYTFGLNVMLREYGTSGQNNIVSDNTLTDGSGNEYPGYTFKVVNKSEIFAASRDGITENPVYPGAAYIINNNQPYIYSDKPKDGYTELQNLKVTQADGTTVGSSSAYRYFIKGDEKVIYITYNNFENFFDGNRYALSINNSIPYYLAVRYRDEYNNKGEVQIKFSNASDSGIKKKVSDGGSGYTIADGSLIYIFEPDDTYYIIHNINGNPCRYHSVDKGTKNISLEAIKAYEDNCTFVDQQKALKPGYTLKFYSDISCTQEITPISQMNSDVIYYGKFEKDTIDYSKYIYYELADNISGNNYLTEASLPESSLKAPGSEVLSVKIAGVDYDVNVECENGTTNDNFGDGKTNVPLIYKYSINGNLVMILEKHKVYSFNTVSLAYSDYIISGFEFDDKKPENALNGYVEDKSVNLRAYYDRSTYTLRINQKNESDISSFSYSNGKSINIDNPTRDGYAFAGYKFYKITVEDDKEVLVETDEVINTQGIDRITVIMPEFDVEMQAEWDKDNVTVGVYEYFQSADGKYNEALTDSVLKLEGQDCSFVLDGSSKSGKKYNCGSTTVVSLDDDDYTYYYVATEDGSAVTAQKTDLFAAYHAMTILVENEISVDDYIISDSDFVYSNGIAVADHDTVSLVGKSTIDAAFGMELKYFYARSGKYNVTVISRTVENEKIAANIAVNNGVNASLGTTANVTAKETSGYEFKGWYSVSDVLEGYAEGTDITTLDIKSDISKVSPLSTSSSYSFKIKGDTELVAVFAPVELAVDKITVIAKSDKVSYGYGYTADSVKPITAEVKFPADIDEAVYVNGYKWYECDADGNVTDDTVLSTTSDYRFDAGYSCETRYYKCVVEFARKDNKKTNELSSNVLGITIEPSDIYVAVSGVTVLKDGTTSKHSGDKVSVTYDGNDYSIKAVIDEKNYPYLSVLEEDTDYSIYYSLQPIDESNYQTGSTELIKLRNVTLDEDGKEVAVPIYYYVLLKGDAKQNYVTASGNSTVYIGQKEIHITPDKAFHKVFDDDVAVKGDLSESGSDKYRLSFGDGEEYYTIEGIIEGEREQFTLDFDATYNNKHVSKAGSVKLTNIRLVRADEVTIVNNNYRISDATLDISGYITAKELIATWGVGDDVTGKVVDDVITYPFDGNAHKPVVTIKDLPTGLAVNSAGGQINAGDHKATAEITAVGSDVEVGDYFIDSDDKFCNYRITKLSIKVKPSALSVTYDRARHGISTFIVNDIPEEKKSGDTVVIAGKTYKITMIAAEYKDGEVNEKITDYINAGTYPLIPYKVKIEASGLDVTDNFEIENVVENLVINPVKIDVSGITAKSKTYDEDTSVELNFDEYIITGVLSGDELTLNTSVITGKFESSTVANPRRVIIDIPDEALLDKATGKKAVNYVLNKAEGSENYQSDTETAEIRHKEVSLTPKDESIAYGSDIPFEFSLPEDASEDLKNALASGSVQISIGGKTYTWDIPVGTKVSELAGVIPFDELKLSVGNYDAEYNFAALTTDNYAISVSGKSKLSIDKKTISIVAKAIETGKELEKVYDTTTELTEDNISKIRNNPGDYYEFSGVSDGDSVELNASFKAEYNSPNVDEASKITLTSLSLNNANYQLSEASVELTASIVPANIKLTAGNVSTTYGTPKTSIENKFMVKATGLLGDDKLADIIDSVTYSTIYDGLKSGNKDVLYKEDGTIDSYAIEVSDAVYKNGNYVVEEYIAGKLTVNPKEVIVSVIPNEDASPILNADHKFTMTYGHKIDGNWFMPEYEGYVGAFDEDNESLEIPDSDVTYAIIRNDITVEIKNGEESDAPRAGEFTINPVLTKLNSVKGNYIYKPDSDARIIVNKKAISFYGNPIKVDSKVYDGTTAVLTEQIKLGDNVSGLLNADGTYNCDGDEYNYSYLTVSGNGITDMVLEKDIEELKKLKDSGIVFTDGFTHYLQKNVGENIDINLSYKLTSYLDDRYEITTDSQSSTKGDITRRPLKITAVVTPDTINYGDEVPVFSNKYEGFVTVDNVTEDYRELETSDAVPEGIGNEIVAENGIEKWHSEFKQSDDKHASTKKYDVIPYGFREGDNNNYIVSYEKCEITVETAKLESPVVKWSSDNAGEVSFEEVNGIGDVVVNHYELELYKEGDSTPIAIDSSYSNIPKGTEHKYDFLETIRSAGVGNYYVTVKAVADLEHNPGKINVEDSEPGESAKTHVVLVNLKMNDDSITKDAVSRAANVAYKLEVSFEEDTKRIVSITDSISRVYVEGEKNIPFGFNSLGIVATGFQFDSLVVDGTDKAAVSTNSASDILGNKVRDFTDSFNIGKLTSADAITLNIKLKKAQSVVTPKLTLVGKKSTVSGVLNDELEYGYSSVPKVRIDVNVTDKDDVDYEYKYQWYVSKAPKNSEFTKLGDEIVSNDAFCEIDFPLSYTVGTYNIKCIFTATRIDNGSAVEIDTVTKLSTNGKFVIKIKKASMNLTATLTKTSWMYGESRGIPGLTGLPADSDKDTEKYYFGKSATVNKDQWMAVNATIPIAGWNQNMITDAGTYYMVVYLPDQANYSRFVSGPLAYTITKNKFNDVDENSIKLITANGSDGIYGDIVWEKADDIYENAKEAVGTDCDSKAVPHYNVVLEYAESEGSAFVKKYEFADLSDSKANIASYIKEKGLYRVTIKSIPSIARDKQNVNPSDGVSKVFTVGGIENESGVNSKIYDGTPIILKPSFAESGLSYTWYKDNSVVPSNADGSINVTYVEQAGTYYCEAAKDGNTYFTPKITLSITPRPITVKTATASFVYDATEQGDDTFTLNYTGDSSKNALGEGDTETHKVTGKITHVAQTTVNNTYEDLIIKHGDKIVYAKGAANNNYTVTDSLGKLTVTKRPLAISSASDSKIYDGTPLTAHKLAEGVTYDGETAKTDVGDVVTVKYTGTITNVGKINNTVVLSGADAIAVKNGENDVTNDYQISFTPGTLEITQAQAEIKLFGSLDKIYDKKGVVAPVAGISESAYYTKTGDGTVSFKYFVKENGSYKEITNPVNAGEYYIKGYLSATKNYKAAESDYMAYTISKRPVTLTANNKQSVYGGVIVALDYSVTSGLTFVDTADRNSLAITLTTTAGTVGLKSNKVRGEYPITISYTENSNYDITVEHGIVDGHEEYGRYTIADAVMSVTSTPVNVVYDSKPHSITVTATANAVSGDTPVVYYGTKALNATNYSTEGSLTKPEYTDVAFDEYGDEISHKIYYYVVCPSYIPVSGAQTVTITRRPVTITANSNSKVYDGTALTDSGYKVSAGTIAENDEISSVKVEGSITEFAENAANNNVAGEAVIVRKSSEAQNVTKNYSISYMPGTLSITQRKLDDASAITIDDIEDIVYDGTYQKPLPVIRDSKSGRILVKDTDYTLTYTNNVHSGVAKITVTAVAGSDYSGSVYKEFNITKRDITLTSDSDTKIYDRTPLTAKKLVTGVIYDGDVAKTESGDTVSVRFTGTITNAGEVENKFDSIVITNPVAAVGNVTNDYRIVSKYGTLTVTEREIEELILSEEELVYTGSETGPATITVKADNVVLTEGTEYVVSLNVENGIRRTADKVGTYTVEVKGTGNYKGTLNKSYKIVNDKYPVISGIEDDGHYCVEAEFEISDDNLYKIEIFKKLGASESVFSTYSEDELTVDGLLKSKKIVLKGIEEEAQYTVKAYSKKQVDSDGTVLEDNTTTVSIHLYKEHKFTNSKYSPDLEKDPSGRILKAYCDHECGKEDYAAKRWGYVEWNYAYEYIIPDNGEIQRGVKDKDQRATESKVELYQNGVLIATNMVSCKDECGVTGTQNSAKGPFVFEYYDPADNTKGTGDVRIPLYDADGNAYKYEIKYYVGSDKSGSFVATNEYRIIESEDYTDYGNRCQIAYEPETFILPWKVVLKELPKDENKEYIVPSKIYVKVLYGMSENADDSETESGYRIITQHSNDGDLGEICIPVEERNGVYSYSGRYDVWKYQAGSYDTYYHRIQIAGYEIDGVRYDVEDKKFKSANDKDHKNHTVYYDNSIPGATGVILYELGNLLPTLKFDFNTSDDPGYPATGPYNIIWAGPDGGEITAQQINAAEPSRAGYIFRGWYTKSEGGTLVRGPLELTEHMTVYAHWEKIPKPDDEDDDDTVYPSPIVTPTPSPAAVPERNKNKVTPTPSADDGDDANVTPTPTQTVDKTDAADNKPEIIVEKQPQAKGEITVDIPDKSQLEDNVITEEDEKAAADRNADILIRVTVDQETVKDKPEPSAEEMEEIAKLIGDKSGRQVVFDRYITLKLEKKIGDADWERIYNSNKDIDVVMNLSSELAKYGDSLYLLVKTDDGYKLIKDTDEILETISFSTSDFGSDYLFVKLEEEDKCYIHFILILTGLLSASSVIVLWKKEDEEDQAEGAAEVKKRPKTHWVAVAVFNGIGVIVTLYGKCRYDLPIEICGIVITAILELVMDYKNKKK